MQFMQLRIFRSLSKTHKILLFVTGLILFSVNNVLKYKCQSDEVKRSDVENFASVIPGPLKYPETIYRSGEGWKGDAECYFFSAYYDYRENTTVVLTMLDRNFKDFSCISWFDDKEYNEVWKPKMIIVPDSHQPRYLEVIVKCPHSRSNPPSVISLRKNYNNQIVASFYVEHKKISPKTEIHWCLSPIHSNKPVQFLEALILHKIIGVDNATFYSANANISTNIRKFDWINTIDWELPMQKTDIQYYGQRAAINDCLFRNMFTARYIIFADLDEIFLPRRMNMTPAYSDVLWKELEILQIKNRDKVSAFYGKSVLFGTPRSLKGFATIWVHKRYVEPQITRRKYIVLPERVQFVNVHWVYPYDKYWNVYLSEDTVVLHHYRRCPDPRKKCCGRDISRNPRVIDKFTLKLKNEIIRWNHTLSTQLFS